MKQRTLAVAADQGRLMPADPARRWQALQWLVWQVAGVALLGDEFTVADIAVFPWVRNLVGFGDFAEAGRVPEAFVARPAVQRGLGVPATGSA